MPDINGIYLISLNYVYFTKIIICKNYTERLKTLIVPINDKSRKQSFTIMYFIFFYKVNIVVVNFHWWF